MTTREEAIKTAGEALAERYRAMFDGTPREAAERAYTPTGPPVEEIERQIIQIRQRASVEPKSTDR